MTPRSGRDLIAVICFAATLIGVVSVFSLATGTRFLMPGPLSSAHSALGECTSCHTNSGKGKLDWVFGLVRGDPLADSKACLTCHKIPDAQFNPHGALQVDLQRSTERLKKTAARLPVAHSTHVQNLAFPASEVIARDLYCATCHQEHQGAGFDLDTVTNAQCSACHVAKFDSFDGDHPEFEEYPFKRRTRIVFDHAGHFRKHYPELAKKDPTRTLPATCDTCHGSGDDKRVMSVAGFEKACAQCHRDQIIGKGRASGPKGIAFLSLPGIDLETLRAKRVDIGEWPEASEAGLTPFMRVMVSRSERGRQFLARADRLSLQDLSGASDDDLKAVADLAWEIKDLFHGLIEGKTSEVLGDLTIGNGAKPDEALAADLTAGLPRDVIIGAQQEWLPNLATEIAHRRNPDLAQASSLASTTSKPGEAGAAAPEDTVSRDERGSEGDRAARESGEPTDEDTRKAEQATDQAEPSDSGVNGDGETSAEAKPADDTAKANPQDCVLSLFGSCVITKTDNSANLKSGPARTPAAFDARSNLMRLGGGELARQERARDTGEKTGSAPVKPVSGTTRLAQAPTATTARGGQSDDLLSPSPEELRAIKAHAEAAGTKTRFGNGSSLKAARDAGADREESPASVQQASAPTIKIESQVDPETWAEYGGWYRQDHAIYYRPTGHKDRFMYAWLFLTGPRAQQGQTAPLGAVFQSLAGKDAQGACTKCHSIDGLASGGSVVNFAPASAATKQGSFTRFIHEPHFNIMGERGCLTCHKLESQSPYLKSYEQRKPLQSASNFSAVKKEVCQQCHTASKARQDCVTCHKYHVNGVTAPTTATRTPDQ